jgi:hypothetical protein
MRAARYTASTTAKVCKKIWSPAKRPIAAITRSSAEGAKPGRTAVQRSSRFPPGRIQCPPRGRFDLGHLGFIPLRIPPQILQIPGQRRLRRLIPQALSEATLHGGHRLSEMVFVAHTSALKVLFR